MVKTEQDHATVSRKGERRLRSMHPWVYRSDVVTLPRGEAGVVEVRSERGRFLGEAFYSPASTITLRLVTRGDERFSHDLIALRLEQAARLRQRLLPNASACRMVHGEADLLPGVFIDRYGDCFALQTTCAAADGFESLLVELLVSRFSARAVVLRDDAGARSREGLRRHVTLAHGSTPVEVAYQEGERVLAVDLLSNQKTGSFLDQAQNHVRVRRYARGRGLDCFTYHGGFALQMAEACDSVVAYDQSEPALFAARRNAERAGLDTVRFVRGNVFEVLPELLRIGERFETIVLDPPAFASTKKTEDAAARAYKEINLRALKLLQPESFLITCSCSGRISPAAFDDIVAAAARDAGRRVVFVERRGAGPDHPVLAGVPETDYLKCRILYVV